MFFVLEESSVLFVDLFVEVSLISVGKFICIFGSFIVVTFKTSEFELASLRVDIFLKSIILFPN